MKLRKECGGRPMRWNIRSKSVHNDSMSFYESYAWKMLASFHDTVNPTPPPPVIALSKQFFLTFFTL